MAGCKAGKAAGAGSAAIETVPTHPPVHSRLPQVNTYSTRRSVWGGGIDPGKYRGGLKKGGRQRSGQPEKVFLFRYSTAPCRRCRKQHAGPGMREPQSAASCFNAYTNSNSPPRAFSLALSRTMVAMATSMAPVPMGTQRVRSLEASPPFFLPAAISPMVA